MAVEGGQGAVDRESVHHVIPGLGVEDHVAAAGGLQVGDDRGPSGSFLGCETT
jgi:hypothetical protein